MDFDYIQNFCFSRFVLVVITIDSGKKCNRQSSHVIEGTVMWRWQESDYQSSVERSLRLLWFCFAAFWLVKISRTTFPHQSDGKLKLIEICSHTFPRVWRQLFVVSLSSNWLSASLVPAVIGLSNNPGVITLVLWHSVENRSNTRGQWNAMNSKMFLFCAKSYERLFDNVWNI